MFFEIFFHVHFNMDLNQKSARNVPLAVFQLENSKKKKYPSLDCDSEIHGRSLGEDRLDFG